MSAQTLACAMRRETAFLLPPGAFLGLSRGHGPATSSKSRPAKPIDFLLANRAEARVRRERVGHPLSAVAEHLLHPSFRWGRGFGPRLPSTSSSLHSGSAPLSRAPGERMSRRVADMHDWRVDRLAGTSASSSRAGRRGSPTGAAAIGLGLLMWHPSSISSAGRESTKLATA